MEDVGNEVVLWWKIMVVGIDKSFMEPDFDRFFQLNPLQTTLNGGRDRLSFCKSIG